MSDSVWPHRLHPLPIPWILQARVLEWVATAFSHTWLGECSSCPRSHGDPVSISINHWFLFLYPEAHPWHLQPACFKPLLSGLQAIGSSDNFTVQGVQGRGCITLKKAHRCSRQSEGWCCHDSGTTLRTWIQAQPPSPTDSVRATFRAGLQPQHGTVRSRETKRDTTVYKVGSEGGGGGPGGLYRWPAVLALPGLTLAAILPPALDRRD